MTWNYRVCKRTYSGTLPNSTETWSCVDYGIHEVYYNKAGEITAVTKNQMTPSSDIEDDDKTEAEALEELSNTLHKMMGRALTEPILDLDNMTYADWNNDNTDDEFKDMLICNKSLY